jgi:hypothetical protein
MRTMLAAALAVIVTATVLSACGDPSSSDAAADPTAPSSSATSATSAPTPSVKDGCPYLTADKVTAALGSPTQETAGSLNACFFDPEGGTGPRVLLSRIDIQINPADYARQTKALCQGEVTEVATGDAAFACVMGVGPQGQVYRGRVLVTVAVNDAADDAAGIAAAVALLPEVTIPAAS